MKKLFTLTLIGLLSIMNLQGQILFEEDFEGGSLPTDWNVVSNATDGGWLVGSIADLSTNAFQIPANGSTRVVATNDDSCDCDKSNESLVMPPLNLTDQTAVVLEFDAYYLDNVYLGDQEDATIEISTDNVTWEVLEDLHGHGSWDTHSVNISDYGGEETVYIRFRYDDDNGWLYGFAIDNVVVKVPPFLDIALVEVNSPIYGEVDEDMPIKGLVYNAGVNSITSMEVSYTINSGSPITEVINGMDIPSFSYATFELTSPWIPISVGTYDIDVEILTANGQTDEDESNNGGAFEPEIFEQVIVPDKMDDFLNSIPELTEVTGASNSLNKPTDLDFFPILGKNELWVINQRIENDGGSTLKISDATDETPSNFLHQIDGNSWHFMSLPTGIAFSDENFNFASSPGVQDANHGGGTFTGPSLWSSHPDIYAQPSGGNGSHLDMLHGSPFSMGIAHEVDNVFWVYDDWNEDIVRYDFVDDHGPGNDDHADAIVRRYSNIGITADGDIPNHMVLDKTSGWLYFIDNGNDRVLRLDINSGAVANGLPMINEPLAEHSAMGGFDFEIIIDSGLDRPCGIEIFGNRLLVGDYASGDIIMYDIDNGFLELGRISTDEEGLTGIKVGPDGNIWFTNRIQNTLMSAQPGEVMTSVSNINKSVKVSLSPNPTSGALRVNIHDVESLDNVVVKLKATTGQQLLELQTVTAQTHIDLSDFPNGIYFLTVEGQTFSKAQKVVLNR